MAGPPITRSRRQPSDNGTPEESDPDLSPPTGSAPGASSTAATGRRPRGRTSAPREAKPIAALRQELTEAYGLIGLALQPIRPLAGLVVIKQAEACADAWVAAAEAFPYVRRMLETVAKGTVVPALVLAHLPILVAIQVEQGTMPIEHPWAQGIRPEIEHVIDQRRREAEAKAAAAKAEQAQEPAA